LVWKTKKGLTEDQIQACEMKSTIKQTKTHRWKRFWKFQRQHFDVKNASENFRDNILMLKMLLKISETIFPCWKCFWKMQTSINAKN